MLTYSGLNLFFRFGLVSPQACPAARRAGWALTFCIAKKVSKNARKYKLPPVRQCIFGASATKLDVYSFSPQDGLNVSNSIACSLSKTKPDGYDGVVPCKDLPPNLKYTKMGFTNLLDSNMISSTGYNAFNIFKNNIAKK